MNFFKKIFLYGIGNLLSKSIMVFLLPLYTRNIIPSDYGKADLMYNIIIIASSFCFLEIWTGLLRFSITEDNKKIFSNVLLLYLFFLVPFIIVVALGCRLISCSFFIQSITFGIIFSYSQILQMQTRADNDSYLYIISGIINSIGQVVSTLLLINKLENNAALIIISPAIGYFLTIITIEYKKKYFQLMDYKLLSKYQCKEILLFSFPLALNSIAFWAMNTINRYFSAYFIGYEASGYLGVASKISMIVILAASVFSLAWQESAYKASVNSDRNILYSRMFSTFLVYIAIVTGLCILFVRIFAKLFIGALFSEAIELIVPLLIAASLSGISGFWGQVAGAEKNTKGLMYSTLLGAFANILFIICFFRRFGIMVFPYGSIIGFSVCSLFRFITINKIVIIKIEYNKLLIAIFAIVICIIIQPLLQSIHQIILAGIVFLCIMIFVNKKSLLFLFLLKD